MGLLHGDIAVARCVCRTPRLCRDIPRYAPVTPDRFYDNLVDNNLNSFHSDQRAQAKKFRKLGGMDREPSSGYTRNTIHAWEVFWSGGITMPDSHTVKFIFLLVKFNVMNIVKLRQGSGKDRQGMAPIKAKGLKA